jgi:hypothetical protein
MSGLSGRCVDLIGRRFRERLRPGDIPLIFFVWYGVVRFVLETFRNDNWTFFGIPTAPSLLAFIVRLSRSVWRHRPGHPLDDPPTNPAVATLGVVGRPVDPIDADAEAADPGRSRRRPDVTTPEPAGTSSTPAAGPGLARGAGRRPGGAVEGLAWLGRPPEARASPPYRPLDRSRGS